MANKRLFFVLPLWISEHFVNSAEKKGMSKTEYFKYLIVKDLVEEKRLQESADDYQEVNGDLFES